MQMRLWTARWVMALSLICPGLVSAQTFPIEVELEGGLVWQAGNDVEVPNDGTATRFSLQRALGSGPSGTARVYLTWHRSESQSLRLLYAPLTIASSGSLSEVVGFAGAVYDPGAPIRGTYTFNSYRASYRWRLFAGERSSFWLGFTAKVRDAAIVLEQGTTTSRTDDLGFVPLLHLAADRRFGRVRALVDVDALAGGPGRAIDASVKLAYDVGERLSLRAGYRTVEGGADVDSVYNFAWLNFATISASWRR